LARIALIPVLVVSILVWEVPWLALWLLGVVVVSVWLDGKISRLWNMRAVWGEQLGPIAVRVLVAVGALSSMVAGHIRVWTVAVLLARDALLVGTLPVYRRRGVEPEVTYLGKAATFALFWSLPLILAGHAGVWGAEALHILGRRACSGASGSTPGAAAS